MLLHVLNLSGQGKFGLGVLDTAYIMAYRILFTGRDFDKFELTVKKFLNSLDNHICQTTQK